VKQKKSAAADQFARSFLLDSLRIRGVERKEAPPAGLVAALKSNDHLAPRHLVAFAVIAMLGETTISELAEQEGIAVSTASLLVTQLVDAGVVERREDPADRRRSVVSVREGLRAESEALLEARLAPLRRVFERFPAEHMDLVIEIFHALTEEVVHAARTESTPTPLEESPHG
jgi:DNA-binding MarR family transcriptional regulator